MLSPGEKMLLELFYAYLQIQIFIQYNDIDWTWMLEPIGDALNPIFGSFFTLVFDVTNSGSFLMSLWNFLPIVGSNPVDQTTFVMFIVALGPIVAYFKWFR